MERCSASLCRWQASTKGGKKMEGGRRQFVFVLLLSSPATPTEIVVAGALGSVVAVGASDLL